MTTPDKQRQAQPPPIILQLSAADGRDSHERVMRTAKAARDLAEASPVEALAHAAVAVDEALASLAPRLADDSDAPKGTPTLSPWWILQLERSYYLTKDQSKLLWSFDELCRDPDLADARDTDAVGLRGRALEFAEQVVSPDFETQDELAEWFLARFETPEEAGLSPSSSGAGWDWAGLGPHNAGAELRARFSQVSEAQESHIVDAVGLLEGSTTQWASKSDLSVEADGPGDSTAFDSGPHLDTVVELSSAARPAAFRHAGLVQRDGLAQLAGLHESQTLLPWLVRQLILATTPGLRELRLPDAEGIRKPGFDGIVETVSGNAWVPDGRSVWELSTTGSPQSKSQSDFTKRTETTDDDERHATTFVTVQLAEWPNVQRWCSQRRAEAKWRDVRAYDLDDLVAWLEVAPSVWFQLSERLGIKTPAVISARAWWQRRLNSTKPPLHADVLLAGRDAEAKRLDHRIRSGKGTTTVVAPSTDEAIEFALAALIDGPQSGEQLLDDLDPLFDRCLLVSDEAEWRRLAAQAGTLVLIPTSIDIAGVETDHHHHVLLPVARHHDTGRLNPSVLPNDDCVNVPPVATTAIADALSASGIESSSAHRLGEIARRNFTALRRTLAVDPLLKRPPWASEEPGSIRHAAVRSAMLAGSWREYGDDAAPSEDREILARLVGPAGTYTYETVAEAFAELSAGPDPLLERTARGWRLIHPVDAWQAVGDPPLTPGVPDRIAEVVVDVLGEPDPAFELSAQHRVMAPAFGWGRRYSSDLRHGLTSTLGILGTGAHRIEELQQTPAHQWVSWAGSLVHRLLGISQEERATANSGLLTRRWADSADHLPLLAEASPNQFLRVLRDALDDPNEPLRPMFADRSDSDMPLFGPSSPHTELLWALETLAWLPEYFGEAVNALVQLAQLDPGGRLANRPLSSLASIFCVWKPQSGVDRDRRLQALRSLVDRYPEIAWRLLPELVPEHFQTLIPSRQPLYGPSTVVTAQPTFDSISEDVNEIVDVLIEASTTPQLLWELTKIADRLPSQHRVHLWSRWRELTTDHASNTEESKQLWVQLDEFVRRHSTYAFTDWALPSEEIDEVRALALIFHRGCGCGCARPRKGPSDLQRYVLSQHALCRKEGHLRGER